MFSIHCRNEPSSLLEKTCCKFSHRTKGRANQKPKVEFKLGTVLVDETKIHQIGISVNTANNPHNIVTMFTVRRLTPYSLSGTTSPLRALRRPGGRRPLPVNHCSAHTTAPFRRCDKQEQPGNNDDHQGQDHGDGGREVVELGGKRLLVHVHGGRVVAGDVRRDWHQEVRLCK